MLLLLCMLHFSTDTSVPSEMVGSLNYSLIFRFQKKKRSIYIYILSLILIFLILRLEITFLLKVTGTLP